MAGILRGVVAEVDYSLFRFDPADHLLERVAHAV